MHWKQPIQLYSTSVYKTVHTCFKPSFTWSHDFIYFWKNEGYIIYIKQGSSFLKSIFHLKHGAYNSWREGVVSIFYIPPFHEMKARIFNIPFFKTSRANVLYTFFRQRKLIFVYWIEPSSFNIKMKLYDHEKLCNNFNSVQLQNDMNVIHVKVVLFVMHVLGFMTASRLMIFDIPSIFIPFTWYFSVL